jgi:hypothetical protein
MKARNPIGLPARSAKPDAATFAAAAITVASIELLPSSAQ